MGLDSDAEKIRELQEDIVSEVRKVNGTLEEIKEAISGLYEVAEKILAALER